MLVLLADDRGVFAFRLNEFSESQVRGEYYEDNVLVGRAVLSHYLQFFFVGNTETVLFINYEKTEIMELELVG